MPFDLRISHRWIKGAATLYGLRDPDLFPDAGLQLGRGISPAGSAADCGRAQAVYRFLFSAGAGECLLERALDANPGGELAHSPSHGRSAHDWRHPAVGRFCIPAVPRPGVAHKRRHRSDCSGRHLRYGLVWGAVAQPYGICLFALAAAFRLAIHAVDRRTPWPAMAAGVFAGLAAGSSLLTAAAVPVLAAWMLFYDRGGGPWKKAAAFAAGAAIACAPAFRLFLLGPRQTWFNLVQYHAHFRSVYWPETLRHDLEVLTSWIQSGPATIAGLPECCLPYVRPCFTSKPHIIFVHGV